MEYDLPEIELKAVQCRDGELFNWLNHLNAVLVDVIKEVESGGNEELYQDLVGRIDRLEEYTKAQLTAISDELNDIEQSISQLDQRVTALEERE